MFLYGLLVRGSFGLLMEEGGGLMAVGRVFGVFVAVVTSSGLCSGCFGSLLSHGDHSTRPVCSSSRTYKTNGFLLMISTFL